MGRLDHWVTMHPELFPLWTEARRRAGHRPAGQLWHARHRVDAKPGSLPIESWGGSSGLLCVALALHLGCDRVVLAGVPMDKMARHYDCAQPWMEARQYHPAWERHLPRMRDKVRSMSGWTRELLGAPDRGWLNAEPD